jgi:hypothetical protein
MSHNGSKVALQFEKHHVSRLPHQADSPVISPCDLWLCGIGMLKAVLKDREFNPSDETEEALMKVGHQFTFDEVQSVFHNWTNHFAWIIENGGEYVIKST